MITAIPDEIRQFIPSYHISLYDRNLDIGSFEKKLKSFVKNNLSENWLPGYIEYCYEPLKKMSNSKVDIPYYQSKDLEAMDNTVIQERKEKLLVLKK